MPKGFNFESMKNREEEIELTAENSKPAEKKYKKKRRSRKTSESKKRRKSPELTKKEIELRYNAEKIRNFMKVLGQELRREGLPVEEDCRIDMEAYKDISPDIEQDEFYVKKMEKKFYKGWSKEKLERRKLMSTGERFERLKTAVLYKSLRKDFIVVRTSRFDDIFNKSDNVIVERETGNVVCAVDDVATNINSPRFKAKEAMVMSRNTKKGGASLNYGIGLEEGKIVRKRLENLPLFHFALSLADLKEAEKNLIPSLGEESPYEKDLVSFFISSMTTQIKLLKLKPELDPNLKRRLLRYEETLKKINIG